jgi:Mg2+-importing ATPase
MPDRKAEGIVNSYWSVPVATTVSSLGSGLRGLSTSSIAARLEKAGSNTLKRSANTSAVLSFLGQFRNPLVLILLFAALVSAFVGEGSEAAIIGLIVLASCTLSFTQEWGASRAVEALQQQLSHKTVVLRDGKEATISSEGLVPGDVVVLSAGSLIPGDGVIIEARDFNVSEAVLTGETFPVVKAPGVAPANATLTQRTNCVFAGTSVRSGTATVLIVKTGSQTEFARIASAVERQIPETAFARGIRRFGSLMTQIMMVMVLLVLIANLWLHRPLIDSVLFSLALAVGITPELLPAIISITLARGARRMAKDGVIVRRLAAIENLGSMDVLCTDKTGTLTAGVIQLDDWVDAQGQRSSDCLLWSQLNAGLQTGLKNPLDEAILAAPPDERSSDWSKTGEIPYDFVRKRLSVIIRERNAGADDTLICKGAFANVIEACASIRVGGQAETLTPDRTLALETLFRQWSGEGYRVLGIAIRRFTGSAKADKSSETELTFVGFLKFLDPPKPGIAETLASLKSRGIAVKMITGDNQFVARHLAEQVGFVTPRLLTGEAIGQMSKEALFASAPQTDIFAEIDPNQKERIIAALRQARHVVGYLGDGINDVPALHEADIGVSVDSAVDVAREAADMILLKQDLSVLLVGITDGRATFINTLKYISIATSANFGNMISMALASVFLPFLPLLAKQILLNNFLSDIPAMAIATDTVDPGAVDQPQHWSIGYIRRFMVCFGLISSIFDMVTFGFLLWVAKATESHFQTGWFVESLVTQLATLLVVRTRLPAWKSRPSPWLAGLVASLAAVAAMLPFTPVGAWFGLVPIPPLVLLGLGVITLLYLLSAEAAKRWFFKHEHDRKTGKLALTHPSPGMRHHEA